MILKNLYRRIEPDGREIVASIPFAEGDMPSGIRIIADQGMVLVKDGVKAFYVDVDIPEGWHEEKIDRNLSDEDLEQIKKSQV